MYKKFLILACAALAAGCADIPASNEAALTYESSPEGATLYEGGHSIGIAPVTRNYKSDGKGGQITTPDVTAVWPSGAKTTFFTYLQPGDDRVATLERPQGAPGLEADLENAKKYKLAKEQEDRRTKEAERRDQAQMSARCAEQMHKGGTSPVDDCH